MRLFFCVNPFDMSLQTTKTCRWKATHYTFVRLFPCVRHLMVSQALRSYRGIFALVTFMWPFPSVCHHMGIETRVCWSWSGAQCALVWLFASVGNSVFRQALTIFARKVAFWTPAQLLTNVFDHMFLNTSNAFAWIWALCALVWLLNTVNLQMSL